ncbi:MAG: hypothetical protein N2376_01250 [Clostridia bacterium]|nr:hypothetical protein [Clostridia bacterium]
MYTDSINMLNFGFDNFLYGTLVTAGTSQKVITVQDQSVNLIPTADVHYIYPKGQNYIKDMTINVDDTKMKPPITKNTIVGMMAFTLLDGTKINVDLYPDREILPQKTKGQILSERLKESRELIYVIIGLIILELIMGSIKLYGYIKKQIIKNRSKKLRRH